MHGDGRPLDADVRQTVRTALGWNVGGVRVHDGSAAREATKALGARAFTVGSDIFVASGDLQRRDPVAQRLLVHELVHTVQHGGHPATPRGPLGLSFAREPAEREAREVTAAIADGRPTPVVTPAPARIARQSIEEIWGAVTGVGPLDALRAKAIADESLAAAVATGLPGIHNGPADAWRHCYWNCRLAADIGPAQAAIVATNHERMNPGPTNEATMDLANNAEGRICTPASCDPCCQTKLDTGVLKVIDGTGAVVPSSPTTRSSAPTAGTRRYYP